MDNKVPCTAVCTIQLSYSSNDRPWPCGRTTIELTVNPDLHYSSSIVLLPLGNRLSLLKYDNCSAKCCILNITVLELEC